MPVVAAGGRPADRYQDVTLLQPTVLGGGAGTECAQPESLPVFAVDPNACGVGLARGRLH